jgi:hypothetical protein
MPSWTTKQVNNLILFRFLNNSAKRQDILKKFYQKKRQSISLLKPTTNITNYNNYNTNTYISNNTYIPDDNAIQTLKNIQNYVNNLSLHTNSQVPTQELLILNNNSKIPVNNTSRKSNKKIKNEQISKIPTFNKENESCNNSYDHISVSPRSIISSSKIYKNKNSTIKSSKNIGVLINKEKVNISNNFIAMDLISNNMSANGISKLGFDIRESNDFLDIQSVKVENDISVSDDVTPSFSQDNIDVDFISNISNISNNGMPNDESGYEVIKITKITQINITPPLSLRAKKISNTDEIKRICTSNSNSKSKNYSNSVGYLTKSEKRGNNQLTSSYTKS